MIHYTLTEYWEEFERNLKNLMQEFTISGVRDQLFESYHHVALKMIQYGKQIEGASLFKKKELGSCIKNLLNEAFTKDNIPSINSFFTMRFAEVFLQQAKLMADGQVYSNQLLVNTHLKLNMHRAQKDVDNLTSAIKNYHDSKMPKLNANTQNSSTSLLWMLQEHKPTHINASSKSPQCSKNHQSVALKID